MTNMFKKSMLVALIAGSAGAANAATVNAYQVAAQVRTPFTVSAEGAAVTQKIAVSSTALNVVITTGAQYIENDVVEVVVTGASLITATGFAPALVACADVADGCAATAPTGGFTFVDVKPGTTDTLRFRVNNGGAAAGTYRLQGFDLNVAGLAVGSDIRVASKAISLNPAIGEYDAAASTLVASAKTQYPFKVGTALSKKIDVAADRYTFEDGATSDSLVVTLTQPSPILLGLADASIRLSGSLTGNYTKLINKASTATTAALKCDFVGSSSLAGFEVTKCEDSLIEFRYSAANVGPFTIDFDVSKASAADKEFALDPSDFGLKIVATHTPATGSPVPFAVFDGSAGSWALNGSSVFIPYMLYGATAEQTIQLTNKGAQTGDISAVAVVGGQTIDLGKVGTSNARSVTSLNRAIREAMAGKGVNLSGSNFAVGLTLITNVKSEDVTVYSAYQRGNGDRLVVVNSSNGAVADLSATNAAIADVKAVVDAL